MRKLTKTVLLLSLCACTALTLFGCGGESGESSETTAANTAASTTQAGTASDSDSQAEGSAASSKASSNAQSSAASSNAGSSSAAASSAAESEQTAQGNEAYLYIGTENNFQQVPVYYEGELTPEFLVNSIAEETGWNLDLTSEGITDGKGGMTVDFASTSAIVVGPPEPQKDEYFVYDLVDLQEKVLDSVARTLQMNFVDPNLGDPSSLDIYFSLNGGSITDGENTIDAYTPYNWQS